MLKFISFTDYIVYIVNSLTQFELDWWNFLTKSKIFLIRIKSSKFIALNKLEKISKWDILILCPWRMFLFTLYVGKIFGCFGEFWLQPSGHTVFKLYLNLGENWMYTKQCGDSNRVWSFINTIIWKQKLIETNWSPSIAMGNRVNKFAENPVGDPKKKRGTRTNSELSSYRLTNVHLYNWRKLCSTRLFRVEIIHNNFFNWPV